MNPYSGHLATVDIGIARAGYVTVPLELEPAARKKLAGRDEAYISLTSGGKLSRFAAEARWLDRQKNKNRSSNKAARQSRRRNRI